MHCGERERGRIATIESTYLNAVALQICVYAVRGYGNTLAALDDDEVHKEDRGKHALLVDRRRFGVLREHLLYHAREAFLLTNLSQRSISLFLHALHE